MIIATIALLTILFGGVDPFLIDRLDKGVKTYVVEDSRKDEILTITKQHKKDVKAFDKLRRTRIKEFKKLDRLAETKASDLENFFAQLPPERIAFQDQAIENRLVDFYVDVRKNTDASELDPIMKAFNKNLSIAPR